MITGFLFERTYPLFPSKEENETILKKAAASEHLLGAWAEHCLLLLSSLKGPLFPRRSLKLMLRTTTPPGSRAHARSPEHSR